MNIEAYNEFLKSLQDYPISYLNAIEKAARDVREEKQRGFFGNKGYKPKLRIVK